MGEIYYPPEEVGPTPRFRDCMTDGKYDSLKMDEAEKKWTDKLRD